MVSSCECDKEILGFMKGKKFCA